MKRKIKLCVAIIAVGVSAVGCGKSESGAEIQSESPQLSQETVEKEITDKDKILLEQCFTLYFDGGRTTKKVDINLKLAELEGSKKDEIKNDFRNFFLRREEVWNRLKQGIPATGLIEKHKDADIAFLLKYNDYHSGSYDKL